MKYGDFGWYKRAIENVSLEALGEIRIVDTCEVGSSFKASTVRNDLALTSVIVSVLRAQKMIGGSLLGQQRRIFQPFAIHINVQSLVCSIERFLRMPFGISPILNTEICSQS